ncbi:MAG: hypothetical protein Q4E13_11865 [Clostridia bacterium]|nr:hypothetical protein [Clostridia bacterium]
MRIRDARGRFAAEDEQRTRWLNLWLDIDDYLRLCRQAKGYGMTLSALVRDIIRIDNTAGSTSDARKPPSEAARPRRRQKPNRLFGRQHVAIRLSQSEFEAVARRCQALNCSPSLYFEAARITDAIHRRTGW